MCHSSLINSVSFVFCEFNFVASSNECKTVIIVRSSFKFPNRNTGFIFKVKQCQCKHFEEKISTYVFGKSFWYNIELKIDCSTSRHILFKKILNNFLWVEVRILVEKWKVYESHIFPRPLLLTCILETNTICLNSRLLVNKKFPNSHYFYWNGCKRLSFMCSPLNDKYNPSCSKT